MRPQTIVNFERIIFATLFLGLIQSYLGWSQATQMASVGFILTVQVFTFCLIIGLTLLVSRRRSKVAMWVSIVLFACGIPLLLRIISQGILLGSGWITVLQSVGQVVAYGLLFSPSARSWLNESS